MKMEGVRIAQALKGLMVLWGVPGTGKSHFARWLVANKGYVHAETDAGLAAALQQANAALVQGQRAG
jgi:adenylate kinase family enzyme